MPCFEELRLMAKVATLYYERKLRQTEIATQLDLSQATVSRLLQRALDENIVRISVSTPMGCYPELEDAVRNRYNLKEAIVVDASPENGELLRNLGAAAAYYLETTIRDGEYIGISSWSETLLATANAMRPLSRSIHARVIQILGGIGNPTAEIHAAQLTRRLANLVHGEATILSAPGVVGSGETRDILLADSFVSEAIALFDKVTLALVGIGSIEPSRLLASSGNVFSQQELEMLRGQGAVGDICLRFFDAFGQPVVTPLDDRVIGISLQQLKRVKRAVGIAGGARKLAAIRGAVSGGWIHVLITDHLTAAHLLEEESTS
ncbi:sugar-binding transcriptional regulator [Nitrospirales bacterium NOB]|nr:sugar-binding transcriptional regulator [Nitrospirales bacterium NOB]